MSRSITEGFVDPGIEFIDHHRRLTRIVLQGRAQYVADVSDGAQVSSLYVVADKAVELQVFSHRKIDALQPIDLMDCKIVAQLGSLQGM